MPVTGFRTYKMKTLATFVANLDFRIAWLQVLLVPLALSLGMVGLPLTFWPFSVLALVPQFCVVLSCIHLRRSGKSPVPYLLINEALIAASFVVIACLHASFGDFNDFSAD